MFNRALIAGLLLCACTPTETKPAATATTPAASASPTTAAALTLANPELAQVDNIAPHAKITSPVHITGLAPGNWYFEGSFPAVVTDIYGEHLGEAPAKPLVNWTEPDPVKKFDVTVTFETHIEQEGMIVLTEDMPGQDEKGNDKPSRMLKIPVILVPSK